MQPIVVEQIQKCFGDTRAVDDVSFTVNNGEIFGLLGPNGAGKTTAIRIILDIFKPDKGKVSILGGAMTEEKKNHIGYLPEERGLYQDMPLDRCLIYLAGLKGLSVAESKSRLASYLERFELSPYRTKKVKELSKGMQQKAQLIAALIHEPQVIIIDEPFSALDPVNTQMVKDLLDEERQKGRAVVMCTHQMHQVEELCDRLVLIDHGKAVLYGTLAEVRQKYATQDIILNTTTTLPEKITGVEKIVDMNSHKKLILRPGYSTQSVLYELVKKDVFIDHFEIAVPSLDEIFIRVVTEGAPNT